MAFCYHNGALIALAFGGHKHTLIHILERQRQSSSKPKLSDSMALFWDPAPTSSKDLGAKCLPLENSLYQQSLGLINFQNDTEETVQEPRQKFLDQKKPSVVLTGLYTLNQGQLEKEQSQRKFPWNIMPLLKVLVGLVWNYFQIQITFNCCHYQVTDPIYDSYQLITSILYLMGRLICHKGSVIN